jgi:hypothetical protein
MAKGAVSAMDRQQAIAVLQGSVSRDIGEFCISAKEISESYAEAREAFHTLGVTDEGMGYDAADGTF